MNKTQKIILGVLGGYVILTVLIPLAVILFAYGFELLLHNEKVKSGDMTLTVVNGSNISICEIGIKPANSQTMWKKNYKVVLNQGDNFVVKNLASDYYDVRGIMCNDKTNWFGQYDVSVIDGNGTVTLGTVRSSRDLDFESQN
jgi:hypothetical protein